MTVEFQVTNGILTQISDDTMLISANGDLDRSFFKKVIVLVLIPFVVVILSVAFWTAYNKIASKKKASTVSIMPIDV